MTYNKIIIPSENWLRDLGNCSKCDEPLLKHRPYFSKRGFKGKVKRYCISCALKLNLIDAWFLEYGWRR